MFNVRLSLAAILLATSAVAAHAADPGPDARLKALFADTDEANLKRNPLNALYRGDLRYADQIGDPYSDAHFAAEKAADQDALKRLAAIPRAGAPLSMTRAACNTSSRAASMRVAISASRNATAWCSMMGTPNCLRVLAYSSAYS